MILDNFRNCKIKRIPHKLVLGDNYLFTYDLYGNKDKLVKLIKVTKKGYNFLDINTNICILKHHLYVSKCPNHQENNETWFWFNRYFKIEKIN